MYLKELFYIGNIGNISVFYICVFYICSMSIRVNKNILDAFCKKISLIGALYQVQAVFGFLAISLFFMGVNYLR